MERYDYYYSLEGDGEFEEGHLFCTPAEAEEIRVILKAGLPPHINFEIEQGGEYSYTTEETAADVIARDILRTSGFVDD